MNFYDDLAGEDRGEDAEDVAQDVWLRVWRRRDSYLGFGFVKWLISIAHNAAVDALRRKLKTNPLSEDIAAPRHEDCSSCGFDDLREMLTVEEQEVILRLEVCRESNRQETVGRDMHRPRQWVSEQVSSVRRKIASLTLR